MSKTLEQILEQHGFADRYIAKGRVEGRVEGEAKAGQNAVVAILRRRFKRVPKALETAIRQLNDPTVLESYAVEAAVCSSLAEFEKGLK